MEEVGTFVWKVDNFLDNWNKECSPTFKLGNHDCFLDILGNCNKDKEDYFRIMLNNSNGTIINDMTSYKLCLMDGRSRELMVKMRRQRNGLKFDSYSVSLMKIWHYDLCCEENYLLPDGALTIRLSWCDEEENNREREKEKESSKLLQTLSENLGRFYESKVGTGTDFILRVGEAMIPVHRAVLSDRSKVFAVMFHHDTPENRSGVMDIPDVDVSVLSDVLYYVYSGQIPGMSADTIVPMYIVADKYALIELRDTCLDVLLRSLTVENVCDAAQLAHTHGETKLEEQVVHFVKEKLEEIEETDKWKELLKSNSSLPFTLLLSALVISKDEFEKLSNK